MTKYKNIDLGSFEEIGKLENGKAFLKEALDLTSCEISVNKYVKVCLNSVSIQLT